MLNLLHKGWLLLKGIGYGIATVLLVLAVVMTDDAVIRYILVVGFSLILFLIFWG